MTGEIARLAFGILRDPEGTLAFQEADNLGERRVLRYRNDSVDMIGHRP